MEAARTAASVSGTFGLVPWQHRPRVSLWRTIFNHWENSGRARSLSRAHSDMAVDVRSIVPVAGQATANHDLADVLAVEVADPDTAIMGALTVELTPDSRPGLPAKVQRARRRGGLGAAGLGALGRRGAGARIGSRPRCYCRIASRDVAERRRGHSISQRLVQETAEPEAGLIACVCRNQFPTVQASTEAVPGCAMAAVNARASELPW